MAVVVTADAFSAPRHHQVATHRNESSGVKHRERSSAPDSHRGALKSERNRTAHASSVHLPRERPAAASLPPDLAEVKHAIERVRQHKQGEATELERSIQDPVAQKLIEWALLRHSDSQAGFERYATFIRANPGWPSIPLLRKRAEARLWQEGRGAGTVRRFFDEGQPTSVLGRLALARVVLGEGDRARAEGEVRAVWQSAELSPELEGATLETFRDELSTADHRARMDRRIGAKDFGAAMRSAKRLGDDEVAIVKACVAVEASSSKSGALLDAVPENARQDLGYALCRLHWLLRRDSVAAAVELVLAASREDLQRQDTNEWWRERRALARRLLDRGDAPTAYRVVREAAPPINPYYRAEFHFMGGWIALRFLGDPSAAREHFAHVDEGLADPTVRARAAYWRGRAAEAAGEQMEMRAQYEAAAQYPTAYYGQLARVRLGIDEIALRGPTPGQVYGARRELLHAADILYTIGEHEVAVAFVADLGEESTDVGELATLGELTAQHNDARAMLLIGRAAVARGLPLDEYAFPTVGVPPYSPIGPGLDRCVVYSIVRTESGFDQRDMSSAKAVGLMQVTPEAGRDTAKRFGVAYKWDRLVSDPVYNTQMGAAEVAALFKEYRGSYVMTFAGYNAGRGRVQEWVAKHGDPRDPKVDAVDWVERIPFAETRNYVQRVMENLQVYRTRFGASIATVEPNLHRTATIGSRVEPILVEFPYWHR
jgi:soluble lytic murein transglycosylase